jgi:S1-C subfamily serine protease
MRLMFVGLMALAWATLGPLTAGGENAPGQLGVEMVDVTQADAARLKWDQPIGVKVVKPQPGSPADKAGIKTDDIIISIDSVEMPDKVTFEAAIAGKSAGWRSVDACRQTNPCRSRRGDVHGLCR